MFKERYVPITALYSPLTCRIDLRRCCSRNEDDTKECQFIWEARSLVDSPSCDCCVRGVSTLDLFACTHPLLSWPYRALFVDSIGIVVFMTKRLAWDSEEEGEVCKEDEVFAGNYLPALVCRILATQGCGSGSYFVSSLQVFSDTSPLVRNWALPVGIRHVMLEDHQQDIACVPMWGGISALCERTVVVLQMLLHWPGSDERKVRIR